MRILAGRPLTTSAPGRERRSAVVPLAPWTWNEPTRTCSTGSAPGVPTVALSNQAAGRDAMRTTTTRHSIVRALTPMPVVLPVHLAYAHGSPVRLHAEQCAGQDDRPERVATPHPVPVRRRDSNCTHRTQGHTPAPMPCPRGIDTDASRVSGVSGLVGTDAQWAVLNPAVPLGLP